MKEFNKKYYSIAGILAVAVASFFAGVLFDNNISPAALSNVFSNNATTAYTCEAQKCVAIKNQCSENSDCITHTECKDKKCEAVRGLGKNQCSTDNDCSLASAQTWCKEHNPGKNLTVSATTYPNGNFTCYCENVIKGNRTQVPCADYHLQ